MTRVLVVYTGGVIAAALAGFFSPAWWTGFVPIAAGAVWAAYDLIEVRDAHAAATPRRRQSG